ncbi:MAG: hypothetical protein ACLQNV_19555 [Steroidobacteraceae bacterium]
MNIDPKRDDELSDEETVLRSEAALLRALSTPHKKQSEMKIGKRKKRGAQQGKANLGRSASGTAEA